MTTLTRTTSTARAVTAAPRRLTLAVALLSAPALLSAAILIVSVTADDPTLGGIAGSRAAEALGFASIIGLAGAIGAAIAARVASRGTEHAAARTTGAGHSFLRGPAIVIAATALVGGLLIAAPAVASGFGASDPAPAAPASPVEPGAPAAPAAPEIVFGTHTDH